MSADADANAEIIVAYAALILVDEGLKTTPEKLQTLLKATNIEKKSNPSGPQSSLNLLKVGEKLVDGDGAEDSDQEGGMFDLFEGGRGR
ncbi:hypothetical protein P280DRAFT_516281 [Massarina eburnea CBS 473.64]|uniref:Uncharacterized protein n=1 Tax=Massarina eburnea CBS 473.64 TaxID=1395130 RepID=A0A6A6S478_9PLEO|nr:hypothetical protein P280DRAFT_516281 [Massarina eburnea CBS 473.64]